MAFSINIAPLVSNVKSSVDSQLPSRAFRAANALRDASLIVLRGQRGGRSYRTPTGGRYTASAPGEPPAVRTGALRGQWRPLTTGANNPAIETNVPYAGYMENGTPGGMIAPRPFEQKIVDLAEPKITAIYQEPFNI